MDEANRLSPWWRELPKRWGHAWHSMCSYLAMFPPALPRYLIEQCSRRGDVVFDPFAGRGTTPFEACLAGRIGIGGDANPLAVLLTRAKVDPPSLEHCLTRIDELFVAYRRDDIVETAPPEIAMLFDQHRTLPQLMYLRRALNATVRVDAFLLATLAGILHGNHPKDPTKARTLSISMPNTFSMAPAYLARYIREHRLQTNPVDAFDLLGRRVRYLFRDPRPSVVGQAALRDARCASEWIQPGSVSLVVTSPPYLDVVRYGKFNWIRLWLLNETVAAADSRLQVEQSDTRLQLADRLRLPAYCKFMRSAIASVEKVLKPGGVAVFVIGDVAQKSGSAINLADEVRRDVRSSVPLKFVDLVEDRISLDTKVTRIWGSRRGSATKIDRLLILQKPGARRVRTRRPQAVIAELAVPQPVSTTSRAPLAGWVP